MDEEGKEDLVGDFIEDDDAATNTNLDDDEKMEEANSMEEGEEGEGEGQTSGDEDDRELLEMTQRFVFSSQYQDEDTLLELKPILENVLENVVLDASKFEAKILKENEELQRENSDLKKWKNKISRKASMIEEKRVQLRKKEDELNKRMKTLALREKKFLKGKKRKFSPKPVKANVNVNNVNKKLFSSTILDYMVRCEEIFDQPEDAALVRRGLSESSSFAEIQRVIPTHLETLEKSFEDRVATLQNEVRELSRRFEGRSEHESKAANAASRVRERKAQRDKKELVQTLISVGNLVERLRATEGGGQSQDLEAIASIVGLARSKHAN